MNLIITVLYELSLWAISLIALPKLLYQFFVKKKYRNSLLQRLGYSYPDIVKGERPLIWIHAVSVGETKAVVPVVKELKAHFPDAQFVVSSISETGHAEALRSMPFAKYHVYLPFDFTFIVSRILKKASPDLVILCESDFWYNFLRIAKKEGAQIAVVNGKMSERSAKRFSYVPFFSKRLFGLFDKICVQNDLYKNRFLLAGAPDQKLFVTGNLKLDEEYPKLSDEQVMLWRGKLGIAPQDLILTIGSSHDPEEKIFIQSLKEIWKDFPSLKVILVPRHPERFGLVAALLEKEGIRAVSYTDIERKTGNEKVILIDAMGMLRMCYQLADLALVAGSFTPRVGGHNILEPCWYGKPVLFGPYMHTQMELVDLCKKYGAGIQITESNLKSILEDWIQNPEERHQIGEKGQQLVKELKGSTKRTQAVLDPLLRVLEK